MVQEAGAITEATLKQMLIGKSLYLRDGYLDNTLSFNEYGHLIGHSPQGSYTLRIHSRAGFGATSAARLGRRPKSPP